MKNRPFKAAIVTAYFIHFDYTAHYTPYAYKMVSVVQHSVWITDLEKCVFTSRAHS